MQKITSNNMNMIHQQIGIIHFILLLNNNPHCCRSFWTFGETNEHQMFVFLTKNSLKSTFLLSRLNKLNVISSQIILYTLLSFFKIKLIFKEIILSKSIKACETPLSSSYLHWLSLLQFVLLFANNLWEFADDLCVGVHH